MTHPLSEEYDQLQDEALLRMLRFQAQSAQQPDLKIARLLRQAANRLEDLLSKKCSAGDTLTLAKGGTLDTCTQKSFPES